MGFSIFLQFPTAKLIFNIFKKDKQLFLIFPKMFLWDVRKFRLQLDNFLVAGSYTTVKPEFLKNLDKMFGKLDYIISISF